MIYLDHHATTPCSPEVVEAMLPFFAEEFGNAASRTHAWGERARRATEDARADVARLIGAQPKEIVFTSGATESDNLAVLGVARANRDRGRHLVTVVTEHKAVLDPCIALREEGFEATILGVGSDGLVHPEAVADALRKDTILCTVMAANNEIGVLQPIAEIGRVCRQHGVPFHTDAAQAAGKIPLDVDDLEVDLLSLSAHKMYGPKGVGALYVRRGRPRLRVAPILHGGGHERGYRSGTLPVPLLVGMGAAARRAVEDLGSGIPERMASLRDRLREGLQRGVSGVEVNGSLTHRLPNNLNVSFEGVEAEALMMGVRDIGVSSGSACSSASLEPSYVLRALGLTPARAHASLRFGLGRNTTIEEIDETVARFCDKVTELRALGAV